MADNSSSLSSSPSLSSSLYNHISKYTPELPDLTSISTYDWTVSNVSGCVKIFLAILCSFAFWRLLQFTVRFYLFGKCTFRAFDYFKFGRNKRRRNIPSSTELDAVPPNKKWRISNEAVSLIHSVVSGLWALYSIATFPKLLTEMNTFTHPVPKFLTYISFGYLAHDLVDLLVNERSARILELLFHHVVVISAFLITIISNEFLGVVMVGLLMEINSIFLHSRSLMNLYKQPKSSTAFKFIALLNIITFAVFRVAVCVFLLYWLFSNIFNFYWYLSIVTFVVIVSLAITNSVLLYRVLAADGLLGKDRARRPVIETTETKTDEDSEELDDGDEEAPAPPARRISTAATQTNENEALTSNQAEDNQPVVIVHT